MGPRQLQTLLSKKVAPEILDVDAEVRSRGQVELVVDFHAFTFWLLGYFPNETAASSLGRVTGLARRLVEGLASRGVHLHFVEDGAQGCNGPEEMESKLTELKSRFAQRQADRAKLKHFLEGTDCNPGQIHSGPLFVDAVRTGIREAGASLQLVNGEADPECVRAMDQRNALAVLGGDTDFVIMQGGRFVNFQNFDPHFAVLPALLDLRSKDLQGERPHEKKFVLKVWTRSALANALEVPEDVLPMVAALCGNDHSRQLIDRCRRRGLPGPGGEELPDSFEKLAKLVEGTRPPKEAALDLLKPALNNEAEIEQAQRVLADVQNFYMPQRIPASPHIGDDSLALVYSEVQQGLLPKWCIPVAAHGLYLSSDFLSDPSVGSCKMTLLLKLKSCAFGFLAPPSAGVPSPRPRITIGSLGPCTPPSPPDKWGNVQVRILGKSEHASFDDVRKPFGYLGRLDGLRAQPLRSRFALLRLFVEASFRPELPASLMDPGAEAEAEVSLGTLHALALRFTAAMAQELKLQEAEIGALLATSYILKSTVVPELVDAPDFSSRRCADFRCLCLGAWFQKVISAVLDLAKLLAVAPPVRPEKLFDGRLFLHVLRSFREKPRPVEAEAVAPAAKPRAVRRGKMGPRTGGESEAYQAPLSLDRLDVENLVKLRSSAEMKAWRDEVLRGLVVQFLPSAPQEASLAKDAVIEDRFTGSAELPITARKAELCRDLLESRVTCVHGETGSGKSTQVPQYILECFTNAQVVVTQPRRMAAINLAKRVAAERGENLGRAVGYRIGGESMPGSRLNFVTTGWLLRALVSSPERIGQLTHVVFDEIHERSADADFLSMVVRLLLHRSPAVRLVIMSATLQADVFRSYFQELQPETSAEASKDIPLVAVGGRCFDVQKVFLDDIRDFSGGKGKKLSKPGQVALSKLLLKFQEGKFENNSSKNLSDALPLATPLILDLLASLAEPGCTILVFLPGLEEISNLYDDCQAYLHAKDGALADSDPVDTADTEPEDPEPKPGSAEQMQDLELKAFAMHSQIPMEDQLGVFKGPGPRACHLVFASNVAESSLTLPSVCAVLDLGLIKQMVYDPRLRVSYLALRWTSQASAHQRAGRAGRTREGVVVRLYPRSFHEGMVAFDRPETSTLPLPRLYLQAKQLACDLGEGDLAGGASAVSVLEDLVDPPDLAIVEVARQELAEGCALAASAEDADITTLGRICLRLPFELALCRLIWLSCHWGCAADGIVLACSMAVQDPFSQPNPLAITDAVELGHKLRRSNQSRRHFDSGRASEPLALRSLFREFYQTLRTTATDGLLGGRRAWIKHASAMASKHAIIPRRLAEFCVQVDDVAQRLVGLLARGSRVERQVRLLLKGLGRGLVDTDDAGSFPCEDVWELDEWVKVDQKPTRRADVFSPFVENDDLLRGLLSACFTNQLVISSKRSQKDQDLANGMAQIADPARSALFDVEHLKDDDALRESANFLKYLSRLSGGCMLEYKGMVGKHVCVQCIGPNASSLSENSNESKEKEEEEDEEMAEMPVDIAMDLHIFHQFTRGKASVSSQMDLSDIRSSHDSQDECEKAEPTPIVVKKPVHPYQIKWQVHAAGEEDRKGRAAMKRTGLPGCYHPLGFMCDVSKRRWLACCSHVQYTQGSICFLSGMTLLKPWQARNFLLMIDPQAANLALRCTADGSVTAVKMFGQELRVELTKEDMSFVDSFRSMMRDALLSSEKLKESPLKSKLHDFCRGGDSTEGGGAHGRWFQPLGISSSLPGLQPLLQNMDDKSDAVADAERNLRAIIAMMMAKKKKTTSRKLAKEAGWPEEQFGPLEKFLSQRPHLFSQDGKSWISVN
ncbi:unnamed protein product [Symbiodinium sp. CCMP2456]|nr:unnamed protein product [Symbiodinium sp. CCMP2456]